MEPSAKALEAVVGLMRAGAVSHPDNDWVRRDPSVLGHTALFQLGPAEGGTPTPRARPPVEAWPLEPGFWWNRAQAWRFWPHSGKDGAGAMAARFKLVIPGRLILTTVATLMLAEMAGSSPSAQQVPVPAEKTVVLLEGQWEGPFRLQKIYPDRVTGLEFPTYPVSRRPGESRTLRVGDSATDGCLVFLTLTHIGRHSATFTERTYDRRDRICPECLAEGTLVDTPRGKIPAERLREGMAVWTVGRAGERVPAVILKTAKVPAPADDLMVHLVLSDGREIYASPGHPVGDGRMVRDVSVGQFLDGSRVAQSERMLYRKGYTYDILPAGGTGLYWADGIRLESTLAQTAIRQSPDSALPRRRGASSRQE